MYTREETMFLEALDSAIRSAPALARIEEIVSRVESDLEAKPGEPLAWEPIPLDVYAGALPEAIRSSWVFVLRAGTASGAERHPNSHQRMMSYRGEGQFQTRTDGPWETRRLTSAPDAPLHERWISIPPNVWHQGVMGDSNWIVVSFHTVPDGELIEERPDPGGPSDVRRRRYVDDGIGR